jgi:adenylate cyclase
MAESTEDPTAESRRARLRRVAREIDSEPRLLGLAARLRSRLPGDDRYGDALSRAGREPRQLLGQGLAALQPQRPSVLNELGLTALQVWQAASEAQGRGRGDREVALLFTDLVAFSGWALEVGDATAVELLRRVADEAQEAISAHDGELVKNLGDGWMAVFADADAAVAAALALHDRVARIEVEGHRPQLRSGIHRGRPRPVGSDYLGVDVNIAARTAEGARPGELLLTEAAAQALDDRGAITVGRAKRLRARGVPRELRVLPVTATA